MDISARGIGDIEVIDNLVTDDPTAALSARQGKVLNEKIENTIATVDIDAICN